MKANEIKTATATTAPAMSTAEAIAKASEVVKTTATATDTAEARAIKSALKAWEASDKTTATAEEMTAKAKAKAIASVVSKKAIKWEVMLSEVKYTRINPEATADKVVTLAPLKVSDFLSLKESKKSAKIAIEGGLYSLLDVFGGNLSSEYLATRSEAVGVIKYASKYDTRLTAFFGDSPASVGSLEKQLQVVFDTLFGDGVVTARKKYVRHLSDSFTRVTRNGYGNGNALALLQLVINHARDAKAGKAYEVKGRLECQKVEKK